MTSFLEDIRVIDFSIMLPGPYCGMLLGDLGAEVVKIEQPPRGDPARTMIPGYFESLNRNKKSMILNLKSDQGKEIFCQLIRSADILLEGFRGGVLKRLGFGYDQLQALNPKIIYCSIAGYGQDSPLASRPGHDINYQGIAGILSLSGAPDGPPDYTIGVAAADLTASLFALSSIMTALYYRERTGKGNCIEVAIADVAVSLMSNRIGEFFARGKPSKAQQIGRAAAGVFETRDGKYITLAAAEEHFWKRLCQVLGLRDLAQDQRFSSTLNRSNHRREINTRLAEVFREREQKEWLEILGKADIPWSPVNTIEDLLNDPYMRSRQLIFSQEHPSMGNVWQVAYPVKFLPEQPQVKYPAPSLGEHNREILGSMGYRDKDMDLFKGEGII
jgi:crotonobetainyl-CoA:carnitine CoA-transferase CaiB-like acyl-CoA transferase